MVPRKPHANDPTFAASEQKGLHAKTDRLLYLLFTSKIMKRTDKIVIALFLVLSITTIVAGAAVYFVRVSARKRMQAAESRDTELE